MKIAAIIVGIDGLRNVLPGSALEQCLYRLWINIVLSREFSASHFASRITLANFRYLFTSQLGAARTFTECFSLSSFGNHVLRIVEVCSEKQMSRVDAGRIITFMANQHAHRDWAAGELVCKPMREGIFGPISKFAVTIGASVAKPKPALRLFLAINQCPKVLFGWMLAKAMPAKEIARFALDPSISLVVRWRDFGFSTATAVAITVGNVVRGMIVHSKFSLLELAHATGRFAVVAVATLLAATGVIIPHGPHVEGMGI